MNQPSQPLAPGALIAGKYRVERIIGQGGMGIVLRAMHGALATPVAVKVLSADALGREETVARFLREARATAGLKSEFVARVTDYGALDDGRPFMVMELLEGEDLSEVLLRSLPLEDLVDAMLQACAGLAEAHAAGIVHRDLKPSNLFRTQRGDGSYCTKVLDFGISKVAERTEVPTPQTSTRSMLGTPLYMSPEQVRNAKTVDARTDIWSLGVVLHEAITGKVPFLGDTLGEVFAAILEQPVEPFAGAHAPGGTVVPAELERVVLACLAKRADDRPQTVADLARRLEPFGSIEGRVAAQRAQTAARTAKPAPAAARVELASMPTSDAVAETQAAVQDEPSAGGGPDDASGRPRRAAQSALEIQTLEPSSTRVIATPPARKRSNMIWFALAAAAAAAGFAGFTAMRKDAVEPQLGATAEALGGPAAAPLRVEPIATARPPLEPAAGDPSASPGPQPSVSASASASAVPVAGGPRPPAPTRTPAPKATEKATAAPPPSAPPRKPTLD